MCRPRHFHPQMPGQVTVIWEQQCHCCQLVLFAWGRRPIILRWQAKIWSFLNDSVIALNWFCWHEAGGPSSKEDQDTLFNIFNFTIAVVIIFNQSVPACTTSPCLSCCQPSLCVCFFFFRYVNPACWEVLHHVWLLAAVRACVLLSLHCGDVKAHTWGDICVCPTAHDASYITHADNLHLCAGSLMGRMCRACSVVVRASLKKRHQGHTAM